VRDGWGARGGLPRALVLGQRAERGRALLVGIPRRSLVRHPQIRVAKVEPMRSRLLVALISIAVGLAMASPAAARVPQGFVGTMLDGPFFYPAMNEGAQMDEMVASGVESVRTVFNWAAMQPYKSFSQIPPIQRGGFTDVAGLPLNVSVIDRVVELAAARRMTVLPAIEYTPAWDSRHPSSSASPPESPAAYARFVAALVRRYGPHGTLWAANPGLPRVPIRMWQIWNEPDFTTYWSQQPFEPGYVKLLRATHSAVKAADPGAKIVLAGLPNFSWRYLANIYRFRGARHLFEVVAVHPYTATPAGAVTILKRVRAVMKKNGDRNKPMLATELSWPSAKGVAQTNFENSTTEAGQATKVGQAVRLLARDRKSLGLAGLYYYTWITNETLPGARHDPFNFAGLFRFLDGIGTTAKPVFKTFSRAALSVEGCRRKVTVATSCLP
jgi:hypothetical protein